MPAATDPRPASRGDRAPRPRIAGLLGLRGLAAFAVLAYHVWRFGGHSSPVLDAIAPHLWHGVTLFLVLSGFLLYRPFAAALLEGRSPPRTGRYLLRRALRVLPVYWLVLLATVLAGVALVPSPDGPRVPGEPTAELVLVNLGLLQSLSAGTLFTGIGPAWSLAVEVSFYVVLPVLALTGALVASRGGHRRVAALLPVAILAAVGVSGKLAVLAGVGWPLGVVRSLWGLADLFALGMLAAVVVAERDADRLRVPAAWRLPAVSTVAAVALGGVVLDVSNMAPTSAAAMTHTSLMGVAATLLILLVVRARPRARVVAALDGRTLAFAGLVSYPAFLWHEPVLHWLQRAGIATGSFAGDLAGLAAITVALAWATHRLVERPAIAAGPWLVAWWRRAGAGRTLRGVAAVPRPGRAWRTSGAVLLAGTLLVAGGCGSRSGGVADTPAAERPATGSSAPPQDPARDRVRFRPAGAILASDSGDLSSEGLDRWRRVLPDVEDIRVRSSADDSRQPALYLPGASDDAPLLVVLHSWSSRYTQHIAIPYARWARRHGFAMIAPDFRGVNDTRQAVGSELAVADVADAIDAAVRRGADAERVYTVGFSGGGMMSLLAAGRLSGRVAGAVSWVPVHDLERWYGYNAGFVPERDYARHIRIACGADPTADERAARECARRSPSDHLPAARRAGVPVYIGHGIDDELVPPSDAARAFNQLAGPRDRLSRADVARLADNRLPASRSSGDARTFFRGADPDVRFARTSGSVTLTVFEGEHDMAYDPGLRWIWRTDNARVRRG